MSGRVGAQIQACRRAQSSQHWRIRCCTLEGRCLGYSAEETEPRGWVPWTRPHGHVAEPGLPALSSASRWPPGLLDWGQSRCPLQLPFPLLPIQALLPGGWALPCPRRYPPGLSGWQEAEGSSEPALEEGGMVPTEAEWAAGDPGRLQHLAGLRNISWKIRGAKMASLLLACLS